MFLLTGCAPDFSSNPLVREIQLDKKIHNTYSGYLQMFYQVEDSIGWAEVWNAQDTLFQDGQHIKFRSNRIWYEVIESPTGLRASQQYPGWEQGRDSIDREINTMVMRERRRVKVDIPAADVVLGGDSIRIAIVHTTGPAFEWDFIEYEPQPDHLLLTTPGNDTMPVVLNMECIGPVSRQTVFRVGKQEYVLRSIGDDYRSIVIELLEDGRGLDLTAELDLNYKQVPVMDLEGNLTTIKRTPGKDLMIYFWGGYYVENELQELDSLYRNASQELRETFDLVAVYRNRFNNFPTEFTVAENYSIPLYQSTEKTCLRLNCINWTGYIIRVNGKGRIVSFYAPTSVVEDLLKEPFG